MRIIQGDFSDPHVVELLHIHLTSARSQTAPGSAHALDLNGLQSPDISFWTIWEDGTLVGVGALRRLSTDHGEIKSMHTAWAVRRRGVGKAMLLTPGRHSVRVALPGYLPFETVVDLRPHQKLKLKTDLVKGSITEAGSLVNQPVK